MATFMLWTSLSGDVSAASLLQQLAALDAALAPYGIVGVGSGPRITRRVSTDWNLTRGQPPVLTTLVFQPYTVPDDLRDERLPTRPRLGAGTAGYLTDLARRSVGYASGTVAGQGQWATYRDCEFGPLAFWSSGQAAQTRTRDATFATAPRDATDSWQYDWSYAKEVACPGRGVTLVLENANGPNDLRAPCGEPSDTRCALPSSYLAPREARWKTAAGIAGLAGLTLLTVYVVAKIAERR